MKNVTGDKRALRKPGKPQKAPAKDRARVSEVHSAPSPELLHQEDQIGPDEMNEDDAHALLFALISGRLCRPTPFAEIAQDCPEIWRHAVQVFGGNKEAARAWLETRSPIFDGRPPIAIAWKIGGRRIVLQELRKLSGSKH